MEPRTKRVAAPRAHTVLATPTFASGLVPILLVAAAMDARAESMLRDDAGQVTPAARVQFKIVIPQVLALDTKSGTIYSNDARLVVSFGRMDGAIQPRDSGPAAPDQALRGVGSVTTGMRGGPSAASRAVASGDIPCIP